MSDRIRVRANGSANAQVTDRVKAVIVAWLRERDVSGAACDITESTVLFTHYCDGNYVAVSDEGADATAFREASERAVEAHSENRSIHEGYFWVTRERIVDLGETDRVSGRGPREG